MKKYRIFIFLIFLLIFVGCSFIQSEEMLTEDDTEVTGDNNHNSNLGNPWVEVKKDNVEEDFGISIILPENAENVIYRINLSESIYEILFDFDGLSFVYRIKKADHLIDISGLNYYWNFSSSYLVKGNKGYTRRSVTDNETVDLIIWFEEKSGLTYTLSTFADDLEGFDIRGIAEMLVVNEGIEEEPANEYSFSSEEDIINLSDEDVIYLAMHDYETTDFIDDLKAEPFDDFGKPLEIFEEYRMVALGLEGQRTEYDVCQKISDEDFEELIDEYLDEIADRYKEYGEMEITYYGETDIYAEYGYKISGGYDFERICFYRNQFWISETIDGLYYAGPVYLGDLTADEVLLYEDCRISNFQDFPVLWRYVEDCEDAIVYIFYHSDIKQSGFFEERGESQKAQIIKTEIIYDKETHRITGENKEIKSVDIPGTKLNVPDPV